MTGQLDPRIGVLNSGRFYCFPRGYSAPELIGTLEEVEAALGLSGQGKEAKKPTKNRPGAEVRAYVVTVTPAMVTYSGGRRDGEYTVEVRAASASEAVKQVRAERRDNEGRYGVRVTYKARLAK